MAIPTLLNTREVTKSPSPADIVAYEETTPIPRGGVGRGRGVAISHSARCGLETYSHGIRGPDPAHRPPVPGLSTLQLGGEQGAMAVSG
jgi:hypothetical protein